MTRARGALLLRRLVGTLLLLVLLTVPVVGAAAAGLQAGGHGTLTVPSLRSAELPQSAARVLAPLRTLFLDAVLGTRFARAAPEAQSGPAPDDALPAAGAVPALPAVPVVAGVPLPVADPSGEVVLEGVPHDRRADALSVTALPLVVRGSDRRATRDDDEPATCSAVGGTTWYRVQVTAPLTLVVDTSGSDHATALAAFDERLQPRGCVQDAAGRSSLAVPVEPSTPVLVQVTAPHGGGALVVRLRALGHTAVASSGGAAEGGSVAAAPVVSGDGSTVVWHAPGLTCAVPDVAVCPLQVWAMDLRTREVELVSRTPTGAEGGRSSAFPSVSADGRVVGFSTWSPDLVPGDTNGAADYVVAHRPQGVVRRVSVTSDGAQRHADPLLQAVQGTVGEVSGDGRYAVFSTHLRGLVPDDDDARADVFRHDLLTGRTEGLTTSATVDRDFGAPRTSHDGSRVVLVASDPGSPLDSGRTGRSGHLWQSGSSGLSQPLRDLADRPDDRTTQVDLSADGRWVGWVSSSPDVVPHDTNALSDVFLTDLHEGRTVRVSLSDAGRQQQAAGSATRAGVLQAEDGRHVSVSADGSRVAFDSLAGLVAGDENRVLDVFVRDLRHGTTHRVSVTSSGSESTGSSRAPSLSYDGHVVGFVSEGRLDEADQDRTADTYVHDERSLR